MKTIKSSFGLFAIIALTVLSCGKSNRSTDSSVAHAVTGNLPVMLQAEGRRLVPVPVDTVQPWEKVDARGFVTKSQNRSISGLYPDSEYQSGVDRFKDDTVSKENGEAIRLASGKSGEKKIAWAMWRLVLGGTQPGVITLDANLGSADAKYFVAVSDYKRNCWQWLGEFDTPNAIIPMKTGEYLSKLGNAFVVVLSYNGASVDVVGAGAHPVTSSDTTSPTDVTNPKAEAVPGGLLLSWDKVAAADLAGYQVSIDDKPINSLTNTNYALVPFKSGKVTIIAIDTTNNSSNPVEITIPDPLVTGDIPKINLTTDITGTQRNGKANLKAVCDLTGVKYDFDLDGDSIFETLDNTTGSTISVYKDTGILRPAVRVKDSSGIVRAFSAVSLIVTSNSRPVVDMTVDKSYGQAPLNVKYTAEFQDFDGTVDQLWWDANGDGTYEAPIASPKSPASTSTSLSTIGITNARVRVADNDGATDVANVRVQIALNPTNKVPKITALSANPSLTTPNTPIDYTCAATDKDGEIVKYEWKFSSGTPDASMEQNPKGIKYGTSGYYTATVTVTDNDGNTASNFIGVHIDDNPSNLPPVITSVKATPYIGEAPLKVDFTGSATDSDGTVVKYDWDFDNDGTFEYSDLNTASTSNTYVKAGYYTVCFRVVDNLGNFTIVFLGIQVTEAPVVKLEDKYEPDGEFLPQDIRQSTLKQTQDHNIYPKGDEDWYKFWVTAGLTYEISSSSTTNYDTSAYIYNENNILQTSDDNSGGNGQFKLSWTCMKFGYYYLKVVGKDPLKTGNYTINYSHTYQGIWSQRGRERTHNGQSYFTGPKTNALKWSYTTGNDNDSSPAIGADGTIYIGSNDNKLYAINANGTLKWSYATGDYVWSSPAIGADGTIYTGSFDSKLYAINANGTLKWSYTTGDWVRSSPAIGADGTIYIGSNDNKLYAINTNGTLKWSYTTGNDIHSTPAIGADGTIYVGSFDNKLYAINANGTLKWSYTTDNGLYSSPAIGEDGTIYVGSYDKKLYAINSNGTLKWSYVTDGFVYSSPAIGADGTIYVGSHDSKLYAINANGTLKWSYVTGGFVCSTPAIGADGTIYVGSKDSKLYAINANGILKWSYATGDEIQSSPAIGADGTVYIGSYDNKLYAIGPGEGY